MQDVRIRIGAAAFLSATAFSGVAGAVAAAIWWIVFGRPLGQIKKVRSVLPFVLVIIFFAIVLVLSGGGGISYAIRMVVVVLIGMWLYAEYRPGDFLHFGTWLLGTGTGFELGMTAEMAMQAFDLFSTDMDRIGKARELKGLTRGIRSLVPSGMILVRDALRRAGESAELLAVRGYRRGGTLHPVFGTSRMDIIAGFAAICMGVIAFLPVSEFFILYH